MKSAIGTFAAAFGAALLLAHAHAAAAAGYGRIADRDDRDAVATGRMEYRCQFGEVKSGVPSAAGACAAAHLHAVAAGRYDDALRYAVIGCEKHGFAPSCRHAAGLPLYMGNTAAAVPASYAIAIRRLAQHVCDTGAVIWHPFAGKVNGRECSAIARHFVLAVDDDYRYGLEPAARSYFEAAYDPAFATRLYTRACRSWRSREGCEQAGIAAALARAERGRCQATSNAPELICRGGLCRAASADAAACLRQVALTAAAGADKGARDTALRDVVSAERAR